MNTISPVLPGCEQYEINESIPALRSPDGRVTTRWTFSEEERRAIANGADLYLTVATSNQPFQPVKLDVGQPDDKGLGHFMHDMRIQEEYELRQALQQSLTAIAARDSRYKAVLNGDQELRVLAEKAQAAHDVLERKKQEVFSPQQSKIQLVQ